MRWTGAALAGATAILSVLVSASLYLSNRAPAQAVGLWPGNTIARGMVARDEFAADVSTKQILPAIRDARVALRTQPGNPIAIRVMAGAAAVRDDTTAVSRWLAYGEEQSRRDLATQLALVEASVQRGDVPGALRHYDRAMRTSPETYPELFPVLSAAVVHREVAAQFAALLRQRPFWAPFFLAQFTTGSAPFEVVAPVVAALHLNPAVPGDRDILMHTVQKGVTAGDFAGARQFLPDATSQDVRNGGFDQPGSWAPFDWLLADDADLGSVVEPGLRVGRGNALSLIAGNGRSGEVARQLLVLKTGRYRVALAAGNVGEAEERQPVITLTCAGSDTPLMSWRLPASPEQGRSLTHDVTVPLGCAGQWLRISLTAGEQVQGGSLHPWIDDLHVRRVGPVP